MASTRVASKPRTSLVTFDLDQSTTQITGHVSTFPIVTLVLIQMVNVKSSLE